MSKQFWRFCHSNSDIYLYVIRYFKYDDGMTSLTTIDRLGDVVRDLRAEAGMNQTAFAAALGTTQSAVSRWERGHDEPRVSTLLAMLRVVGRTLELGDDVDRAQIRQHLAMTPAERLRAVANVSRLRHAASS